MSSTLSLDRVTGGAITESPQRASAKRDPWFDNAKMLLVTLVVVGHSWTLLPEESLARNWFYDFLYLWHMPAFLMVTGYLSRSFTWTHRNLSRLVTVVAVPYVVFEAAMAVFRVNVGDEDGIQRLFIEPHWPMWFLAALFFWRLATPLLKVLPVPVLFAVAVSVIGGLLPGDVLDIGRITGMLPFFVLGLVARPEHVEMLRDGRARLAAVGLLVVAFLVAPFIDGHLRTEWLYWRSGYDEMGTSFVQGSLLRLGLLAATTLLALSALALIPRVDGWFTRLGAATMVVYLFHGFALKAAEYADVLGWATTRPWLGLLAASTGAAVLALVLAAPPVARRLNVVVDPVGAYRRRRASREPDRAGTTEPANAAR